jgi:hypothetical protein
VQQKNKPKYRVLPILLINSTKFPHLILSSPCSGAIFLSRNVQETPTSNFQTFNTRARAPLSPFFFGRIKLNSSGISRVQPLRFFLKQLAVFHDNYNKNEIYYLRYKYIYCTYIGLYKRKIQKLSNDADRPLFTTTYIQKQIKLIFRNLY